MKTEELSEGTALSKTETTEEKLETALGVSAILSAVFLDGTPHSLPAPLRKSSIDGLNSWHLF